MKAMLSARRLLALTAAIFACALDATAQPALVSTVNPGLAPASAGGDSVGPIVSRDGRYVLFSSTANNLATNLGSAGGPAFYPAVLNVFLCDRTNGTTVL